MRYDVILSDKADLTFEAIKDQLLSRWGLNILLRFEEATQEVLDKLSVSPLIYQVVNSNTEIRRAVVHKNCSLFYRVSGTMVIVLFFWDNRQDPIF